MTHACTYVFRSRREHRYEYIDTVIAIIALLITFSRRRDPYILLTWFCDEYQILYIAKCIKIKMNEDEMFPHDSADVISMYLLLRSRSLCVIKKRSSALWLTAVSEPHG